MGLDFAGCGRFLWRCLCAQLPRKCGTPIFGICVVFDVICLLVLYALIAGMDGGLPTFIVQDVAHFDFHTSLCDIVFLGFARAAFLLICRCFARARAVFFPPALCTVVTAVYHIVKLALHKWVQDASFLPEVFLFASAAITFAELYLWARSMRADAESRFTINDGESGYVSERTPLRRKGKIVIGPVQVDSDGSLYSLQSPYYDRTPVREIVSPSGDSVEAPVVSTSAPTNSVSSPVPNSSTNFIGANYDEAVARRELDGPQRQALQTLIHILRRTGVPPDQATYWDAAMIHRFLFARDYDVQKAHEMIKETMAWRSEYRPDLLRPQDIMEDAKPGKVYVGGTDRQGRAIVYMRNARDNDTTADEKLRYVIYTLERAVATMRDGAEKMIWVIDLKGMSARMASPTNIKMSIRVLQTLQNHYPERLGVAIFINQPWVFSAFWSAIKQILNEKTCRKVLFVKKDTMQQQLAEIFDLNDPGQLEAEYGGANPYVFRLADWVRAEMDYFAQQQRLQQAAQDAAAAAVVGAPPPASGTVAIQSPAGSTTATAAQTPSSTSYDQPGTTAATPSVLSSSALLYPSPPVVYGSAPAGQQQQQPQSPAQRRAAGSPGEVTSWNPR